MAGDTPVTGRRALTDLAFALLCYSGVAALTAVLMYLVNGGHTPWLTFDATRLHTMAEAAAGVLGPRVDFITPEPPLGLLISRAIGLVPREAAATVLVMVGVNVLCAILIYWIGRMDYGNLAGFSAGLLFLVPAVLVQGYLPLSGQLAVLFLVIAFMLGREDHPAPCGLCLGLAIGFEPYAILALPGLLILARVKGGGQAIRYAGFFAGVLVGVLCVLGALSLSLGRGAIKTALAGAYGIPPALVTGHLMQLPVFQPASLLAFTADLIASVVLVVPLLLLAVMSIRRRGLRTGAEQALGLLVLFLLGTVLLGQYLSAWILMLPFLCLLACRGFGAGPSREADERTGGEELRQLPGSAPEAGGAPDTPVSMEGGAARGKIVFSSPVTGVPGSPGTRSTAGGLVPFRHDRPAPGKGEKSEEEAGQGGPEGSGENRSE